MLKNKFFLSRKNTHRAYQLFKNYYHEKSALYRMKHALAKTHSSPGMKSLEQNHYSLAEIDDTLLHGFYSSENVEGKSFRWSNPISAIKLTITPGNYQASIKLLPKRSLNPYDQIAIFLNDKKIKNIELKNEKSEITFTFSIAKTLDNDLWLLTFIKPWHFSIKLPDERILGLPIQQLYLEKII